MVEDSFELSRVYPLGKRTRQLIVDTAFKYNRYHQAIEERASGNKAGWEIYDSHLDSSWQDDSSFQMTFGCLLPDGESSMTHYIERLLIKKRGSAIGIELGGPGSNLFSDFSPGFFLQTAGVTLADVRPISLVREDYERKHKVIAGDIFSDKMQKEIACWLAGRKIDVIFERMSGGLNLVPPEPRFLASVALRWYEMLAEGGVMFVQVPTIFVPIMEAWKNFIEQNFPNQIQIRQKIDSVSLIPDVNIHEQVLRLNKLEGAPVSLPLLSPRKVRDLYEGLPFSSDGFWMRV